MNELSNQPSPYDSKTRQRLVEKAEERRLEVETRLGDLRRSVKRESGWLPTGREWIGPLLGLAVGVVLARGRANRDDRDSTPD